MALPHTQPRVSEPTAIPDRLYFKIGDVARICGLEAYVLRFWETQFPQLKPNKSGNGQRLYRRRDVELVLRIKQLVHVEGYTIPGARQALEQGTRRPARGQSAATVNGLQLGEDATATTLAQARSELREIVELLAAPRPQSHRRRAKLATMPPVSGSLFPIG